MKRNLQKAFGFVLFFFIISCSGTVEKSWVITDFSKGKTFELKAKKSKMHSSAIVYINGNVNTDICFRSNPNDDNECREFSADTTHIKSRYDFYGGTFYYYLLPSNAKGKIKITIELPFYSKLF